MSPYEEAYVVAHMDILRAVSDCTKYISASLRAHVDYLETFFSPERREQLKRIAERRLNEMAQ